MKKLFSFFVILLAIVTGNAQNVGIGTINPDSNAQLDVSSTTKGFLPPRMDSGQRNAIVSPPGGLTIYYTTSKGFEIYNGIAWFGTSHYIGEQYGGGKVFYVYDGGQHGLIVATVDLSSSIRWYAGTYSFTRAMADGIGAGLKNTAIIIANQGDPDYFPYAATLCNEYSVTVGGVRYGDWYLPSKYELYLLFLQRFSIGLNFTPSYYWSSTEYNNGNAWRQSFLLAGSQSYGLKDGSLDPYHVRAIRAF